MLLLALSCISSSVASGVPNVEISQGVEMPMLAFGSATISFKKECTVQDAVEQWLRLGGRHIDTAWNYHTQPDVGKAIKLSGVPRKDIFLTTKIPGPIGKQQVIDLITNTSLPQLAVDYIDLVLIHFPCEDPKQFPNKCGAVGVDKRIATFDGLEELKKAGKIRAIGVSNYNEEQIGELISRGRGPPAVNQVEWHLGFHDDALLKFMKEQNSTLEAWGALSGPTAGAAGHPGVSLGDERLQEVAGRYKASTAQVALRWSVHKGVVPVTATCSKDHALGDLAAFDFDLSEQDVSLLDAMRAKGVDFIV